MGRVRTALASLTAGQRWTASLALVLAFAVLIFGMPDQQAFSSALSSGPTVASSPDRYDNPDAAAMPADDVIALPALNLSPALPLDDLTEAFPSPVPSPAAPPPGPPSPEAPAPAPTPPCPAPVGLTGVGELDAVLCALFVLVAM